MGLGLEVGILADLKKADDEGFAYCREQFEIVSKVLRAEGLKEHIEPQELDEVFSCGMFGYAGLHYLRRVAIHMALGKPMPHPAPGTLIWSRHSIRSTGIAFSEARF